MGVYYFSYLSFFFFFFLFLATHGIWSSWSRDQTWAIVVTYACSWGNTGSFNQLCQAQDPTSVLALQRCGPSHCATAGTPLLNIKYCCKVLCNMWSDSLTYGVILFFKKSTVTANSFLLRKVKKKKKKKFKLWPYLDYMTDLKLTSPSDFLFFYTFPHLSPHSRSFVLSLVPLFQVNNICRSSHPWKILLTWSYWPF